MAETLDELTALEALRWAAASAREDAEFYRNLPDDEKASYPVREAMATDRNAKADALDALLPRLAQLVGERDRWKEQASDNARHGFVWQDKAGVLEEALRRIVEAGNATRFAMSTPRLQEAVSSAAALLSPSLSPPEK